MDQLLATTLRALMRRQDWNQYQSLVTGDMFANSTAKAIYVLIGELHGQAKRNVTTRRLQLAIKAQMPEKRQEPLLAAVDSLSEVTKDELADADISIRAYGARYLAVKASRYIATRVGSTAFDYGIPAQLCEEAKNISQGKLQQRVESRDAGLPGEDGMVRHPVPLGLSPELDASIGGGVATGELLFFLAPPKRGKTSYLYRVAANATMGGESVLAFTLEIAPYKGWLRYYQSITGLTVSEMMAAPAVVETRRSAVKGNFWLMNFCDQPLTPGIIKAEGEKILEEGLPLTYIMVDYMEIMQATSGYGRGRHEALSDMVIECRRVANYLGVKMVSAWQVNRIGAPKDVFDSGDISECWDAIKHADIVLGLNQSDTELANGVMRIKVLEQRESTARPIVWLKSDMKRMDIGPYRFSKEANNESGVVVSRDRSGVGLYGPRADKK